MADFVQTAVNKTTVRDLVVPIASVTSFNTLVESVNAENPFGCVGYTTKARETVPPVIKNREHYTAKVNSLDEATGNKVGTVSLQSPTIAAFNANAAEVMDNAARLRDRNAALVVCLDDADELIPARTYNFTGRDKRLPGPALPRPAGGRGREPAAWPGRPGDQRPPDAESPVRDQR